MTFGDAHASTPAFVNVNTGWPSPGAGGTSAAFSPPADSLVRLVVFSDTSAAANPGNETVTDTSMPGTGSWTFKGRRAKPDSGSQAGCVALWEKYFATAPGSIQVTVVGNATGANAGGFSTKVVAGCSGTAAIVENSNTAGVMSITVTTVNANVRCEMAGTDWNVAAAPTAGAGQTAILSSAVGAGPDTRVYVGIQNAITPTPGTAVGMGTASPATGNANNCLAWELVPSAGSGGGVTLADTSNNAGSGGSPDTITSAVIKVDTSGNAGSGGSPDVAAAGVRLTDTSGNTGSSGTPDVVAVGVTVTDTSGNTGAGSSGPETVTRGVLLSDTSGNTGSGSSGQLVASGVVLVDTSGNAGAGSSADTAGSGTFLPDASGGAGAGSSGETLVSSVVLSDASGGAGSGSSTGAVSGASASGDGSGGVGAGGSPDTGASGVVLQDASGGVGSGSSPGLVIVPADVTISDASGGSGSGSSTGAVATSQVVQDTMVMPVLLSALACLQSEAGLLASPPEIYTIRPGDSFEPSADPWIDECCAGVGWARMVSTYETYEFPEPATVVQGNCPPHSWAVVVEVGINRCVPVAADPRGGVVTSAQWLAAAIAQADDGAALRRVLCCLRDLYDAADVTAGQVNPLPLQANCGGVVLQITVRRDACDCPSTTH